MELGIFCSNITIELGSVSKSLCCQNRYRTWHRWMIRVISLKRRQLHLAQVVQVVKRAQFLNSDNIRAFSAVEYAKKQHMCLCTDPPPPLFTPLSRNDRNFCSQRQLKQQPLHQSSTIMDQNRDQNNLKNWSFINHQALHQSSQINKTLMKTVPTSPRLAALFSAMEGQGGPDRGPRGQWW